MSGSGGVSSSPLDDVRASATAQINQPKIAPLAAFTADPDDFASVPVHRNTARWSLTATMKKAIVSLSIIGSLALVLFL